jgi:hypothetical protein
MNTEINVEDLKRKKYRFISDPGHAWLEVPLADISLTGIADWISTYSYVNHGYVYLEEDCDAGLFIDAVGLGQGHFVFEYQESTPIHGYQRWGKGTN